MSNIYYGFKLCQCSLFNRCARCFCTWNSSMDFPLLDSSMKRNAPIPVLGLSASSLFPCKEGETVGLVLCAASDHVQRSKIKNEWTEERRFTRFLNDLAPFSLGLHWRKPGPRWRFSRWSRLWCVERGARWKRSSSGRSWLRSVWLQPWWDRTGRRQHFYYLQLQSRCGVLQWLVL